MDPFPDVSPAPGWTPPVDSVRNPGESYSISDPRLSKLWGFDDTSTAGRSVSEQKAMTLSAFFGGVTLISEAMGSMPIKVYKERKSASGWDYQDQHPVNYCLNKTTNGWQTPSNNKAQIQSHLLMSGNSVSFIHRNGRGQGEALTTYLPINTIFQLEPDNSPSYGLRDFPVSDGEVQLLIKGSRNPNWAEYDSDEVLHIRAFSPNGYVGWSTLAKARNSLALSLTVEEFGYKFFTKGRPAGFLTKDGNMRKDRREELKDEWAEFQEGVKNAFNVGILSGGLKWQQIGYTNDDAQFLQSRLFQVLEVARWLRIPPHMLAELTKATNSNIEQLMQEFITFTLLPWIVRWEEEINLKMFTPREQSMGFCAFFDTDAFLRGDSSTRATVNEKNVRNGLRTLDEVRITDKLNPYPDGSGTDPLIIASQLDYLANVKAGTSKLQSGGKDPNSSKAAS